MDRIYEKVKSVPILYSVWDTWYDEWFVSDDGSFPCFDTYLQAAERAKNLGYLYATHDRWVAAEICSSGW